MDNELVEAVDDDAALSHELTLIGAEYAAKGLEYGASAIDRALDRLASLRAENEALRQWVEDAYLEGYSQGMVAGTLAGREDDWAKSKARAALTKQGG